MEEKMTAVERGKLTEKLQKLLALTASPNEHEARLAMDMATNLMEKYSLSMSDIPDGKSSAQEKKDAIKRMMTRKDVDIAGNVNDDWESILANTIGNTFDCELVRIRTFGGTGWALSFMGTHTDVEMSSWFFQFVRRSIGRMSNITYPNNKSQRKTFAWGMSTSVTSRLREMYTRRNEITNCKDLVIVKKDLVTDFMKDQFPKLRKGRTPKIDMNNREAYMRGVEEGRKVNLSQPLNGNGGSKQLN